MTDRIELVATVLLAVAAVATAWASYQSTRWHGKQAKAQARSIATRVESRARRGWPTADADRRRHFTQWVDAYARDETELVDFYAKRFRASSSRPSTPGSQNGRSGTRTRR